MGVGATGDGNRRSEHRYGRGTFKPHPARIEYMEEIVKHKNYRGMPGARSDDGRINWQVSSGKTTSFYTHYKERAQWWTDKADELGIPGKGKENDRRTIAARRIHPTGYRPCLLCGESRSVGYFYLSANGARRFNKLVGFEAFQKLMPIDEAIGLLRSGGADSASQTRIVQEIHSMFPERAVVFEKYGITREAFEHSNWISTVWLSPGYMGNPPDRFDGLHDYCIFCRSGNDPGRSESNLRSYQRDRRVFEQWAEGDWQMANDLYNSAGPGKCSVGGGDLEKVSPDHVGPLACGFKQIALFMPVCKRHNSSKNRRMTHGDVQTLLEYEKRSGDSAASWQVRGIWDKFKNTIKTDEQAKELSAHMRAVQDCYLRCLHALGEAGAARFLRTLLHPEYAHYAHHFKGLDTGLLTFDSVQKVPVNTSGRSSLASRSVRIAFTDLVDYVAKSKGQRRLRPGYSQACMSLIERVVAYARALPTTPLDSEWDEVFRASVTDDQREEMIKKAEVPSTSVTDLKLKTFMQTEFDALAELAVADLS